MLGNFKVTNPEEFAEAMGALGGDGGVRSVSGRVQAVHSDGRIVAIDLEDIYQVVASAFGMRLENINRIE